MDAVLYFQLVDAIANIRSPRDLAIVSERVANTPMHPLERKVLDRALRARSEALDLLGPTISHDTLGLIRPTAEPRMIQG
jgi:hypothetical protein